MGLFSDDLNTCMIYQIGVEGSRYGSGWEIGKRKNENPLVIISI
jgi:hypothetical protein